MKALLPLAWLYGAGVALRNAYYDRVEPKKLPVPVVSVGNLSVGGSGKTPLVAALARRLASRGVPVAVVSRGYGREGSEPFVLVSDGRRVLVDARVGGDEPVELAEGIDGLAVAVGPDRYEVGRRLIEELGPRLIVLDDGFQHRRLARDLDLVCLACGEQEHALLPAGRLREPVAALKRADAVVLTEFREGCEPPAGLDVPVLRGSTGVVGFSSLRGDGERLPAGAFRDEPVGVMAAVARPERVRGGLEARVVSLETRRDHHLWTAGELERAAERAAAAGAKALLTTGKDAVKLRAHAGASVLPLYRIDIEATIEDEETLDGLLGRLPSL